MSSYPQLWWLQHLAGPMLLLSDILCRRVAIVRVHATCGHASTHSSASTNQGAAPNSVCTASLASAHLQRIGWQATQVAISLWIGGDNVWLGTRPAWWCSIPRGQVDMLLRAASHHVMEGQAAAKEVARLR